VAATCHAEAHMFLGQDFNRLWALASEKPTISLLCSLDNHLRVFFIGFYPLLPTSLSSPHPSYPSLSVFSARHWRFVIPVFTTTFALLSPFLH